MLQKENTISYLGADFSYHHLAAMHYFEDAQCISAKSFDTIISNVQDSVSEFGVIAIDNTLAGAVTGNLERVIKSGLTIYGEIYLQINFHLAAIKKMEVNELMEIYSHHMAIKETHDFFSGYQHLKFIETVSTAGAVKKVAEEKLLHAGAIGNSRAIEHYGMHIIAYNIDNHPD
ncbi:MAG: hypothetical protein H7X71_07270, partial [Chitinophagales bacterium]|nr:hypothetical protein [Chitinophagales bacterium]